MDYTEDSQVQIKNARNMWKGCKVFISENEAFAEATRLYDEVGYTEYGIEFVNIDAEF